MRLPEFTRSTTLRWGFPSWPYMLWLWAESSASRYCAQPLIILFPRWRRRLFRLAGGKPATEGQQDLVARRRKVMHNVDTVARRDDPVQPTSGLDAKLGSNISRATANTLDELWQRAMKNGPRADGLRDDSLRKAAQRIVKEIRARRNLRL